MDLRLAGRTALITGAGRGLGRATAARLAAEGAETILVGRQEAPLQATAREIEDAGGAARVIAADLGRQDQLASLIDQAGAVDILINNAAAEEQWAGIVGADIANWRGVFEINVFAPVALIGAFSPGMSARGWGVIVNMSSIGGSHPAPYLGTYAASKAALDMVTRVAAMELAGSGVRVNGIASGITDMGKTHELLPASLLSDIGRIVPARRLGGERDIAGMVSFLCSADAEYVNGQTLTVDGAMTAGLWAVSTVMTDSLSQS
jgi:NAD(P)-dependent dehydrogenase (short-subunit alcohol dehydrogenase family)